MIDGYRDNISKILNLFRSIGHALHWLRSPYRVAAVTGTPARQAGVRVLVGEPACGQQ